MTGCDDSLRILQVVTDIRGPGGEIVTDIRGPGGEIVTDIKTTGSGEIITEVVEGRNLTVEAFISAPQGQPLDKKYYSTIMDRPLDEQLSAAPAACSHFPLLNIPCWIAILLHGPKVVLQSDHLSQASRTAPPSATLVARSAKCAGSRVSLPSCFTAKRLL